MRDEPGRGGDWQELMRTMLLPTPSPSSCRMANKAGTEKPKKSKKTKSKHRVRGEPKFEFLLCTVFKNVFGSCSKDSQGSSIKVIAHKIRQLETKMNDIEKNCLSEKRKDREKTKRTKNPVDSEPNSPNELSLEEASIVAPKSGHASPKDSPPRSPPSTPPNKKEIKKNVKSKENLRPQISSDSLDESYEIKILKLRGSTVMSEGEKKEREEYLKKLKKLGMKPTGTSNSGRVERSTVREKRKSPRYSVDLFQRRTTHSSGEGSRFGPGPSQRRRITQYFQEQPTFLGKAPEIEPSSSLSIPTYVVENETEYVYVTHGTGQKMLASRKTSEKPLTGGKMKYFPNPFTRNSSGTCIYDWRMTDESVELMGRSSRNEKGSLFKIATEREDQAAVCFAAPAPSTSSESLLLGTVCIVKSKSSPLIGRKFRHRKRLR